MKKNSLLLIILLSLLSTEPSLAQDSQGYASFEHLSTPSAKKSLVDLAPGLLTFFNNGPVFGIPGTRHGENEHRALDVFF